MNEKVQKKHSKQTLAKKQLLNKERDECSSYEQKQSFEGYDVR